MPRRHEYIDAAISLLKLLYHYKVHCSALPPARPVPSQKAWLPANPKSSSSHRTTFFLSSLTSASNAAALRSASLARASARSATSAEEATSAPTSTHPSTAAAARCSSGGSGMVVSVASSGKRWTASRHSATFSALRARQTARAVSTWRAGSPAVRRARRQSRRASSARARRAALSGAQRPRATMQAWKRRRSSSSLASLWVLTLRMDFWAARDKISARGE
mmetsp:Transcript_23363/g.53327  ORF Transcript_23363/g.53327 Transcript_23363/m.53327 type:complete len:221 (-) Transcript_23363:711-1373(-)